jgi:membrane protein required for colicin V production
MLAAELQINVFDAIVFGILFLSAILSMVRGFIREALSLIAWVGAAFFTLYNVEAAQKFLMPHLEHALAAAVVGTLGTYFLALALLSIVNAIIMRYVKSGDDVGALDNIFGMFFGVLKGSLIIVLGFYILTFVYKEEDYPEWIATAYTRPTVESGTRAFIGMMPEYLGNISTLTEEESEYEAEIDEDAFGVPQEEESQEVQGEDETGYDPFDVQQLEQLLNEQEPQEN